MFQRAEKLSIKMGYIFKKMADKIPDRFFRFNVFLSTVMAKPALHFGITIQAVIFLSLLKMAHLL
jgi:hypothetical protein